MALLESVFYTMIGGTIDDRDYNDDAVDDAMQWLVAETGQKCEWSLK